MAIASPATTPQESPLRKAAGALDELRSQERALQGKLDTLGITLAREGRLTREQRSTMARTRKELKSLRTKLDRAGRVYDREVDKDETRRERERQRADAAAEKARAKRSAQVDRRAAQLVASARRKACYAALPHKARPSKATSSDNGRPVMQHALLTKEGTGKKARWVLLVTDSYQLAVLPLDVSDEKAVRKGVMIPPDSLKQIEKAGAFRITKQGAIQPLNVGTRQEHVVVSDDYAGNRWITVPVATAVGSAIVPPERSDYPNVVELVPKRPAKANSFRVRIDADVLGRFQQAAGTNSHPGVELTFDLSKAGKASEGRHQPNGAIRVEANGVVGAVMPVRLDA